jgi:AraC-like DNA-binding protein
VTQPGPPLAPADPLAQALHLLGISGSYYGHTELTEPWGLELPPMEGYLWFHVLTSGSGTLEVGDDLVELRPGDLSLVPHGAGHRLRSEAAAPTPSVFELDIERVGDRYEILRHGGGGQAAIMVCCAVRFAHPAARNLAAALPAFIHIPAAGSADTESIEATVRLMAAEARALRPGGETVVTRLADVLVVQTLRSWIERDPAAQTGWLGALRDPLIGRAIALIHADPARNWTVASLAAEVAMSRSAFAARFTRLVGEPAMSYVARWRMNVALDALGEDDVTIAQLADRLGYRSEAAFSRAFKRLVGMSPGAVRKRALARPSRILPVSAR